MADDRRVYSDEEFALILRKATELANQAESPRPSSDGMTLSEMKAVAAQVGLEPAFVERAARMLVAASTASPLERLTGGPLRHNDQVHFPIKLDANSAALLLSVLRVRGGMAGYGDVGHSSSVGMSWHDGGTPEALSVTAHPEEDGTVVSVALDRSGTLAVITVASGLAMFFAVLFAVYALYPESPAQGLGGLVVGIGGPLAMARAYWASSTKRVRERISGIMDAIGQALTQSETQASRIRAGGDGAAVAERDASAVGDTEVTEVALAVRPPT